jgi:hypothetical protein
LVTGPRAQHQSRSMLGAGLISKNEADQIPRLPAYTRS